MQLSVEFFTWWLDQKNKIEANRVLYDLFNEEDLALNLIGYYGC